MPSFKTGCGAASFTGLPCVSPAPAQLTRMLSDGAQNTSELPAACGQSNTLLSCPEHASSLRPGGTSPQESFDVHFATSVSAPRKPMDLQITAPAPELIPLEQIGTQASFKYTSGRPVGRQASHQYMPKNIRMTKKITINLFHPQLVLHLRQSIAWHHSGFGPRPQIFHKK